MDEILDKIEVLRKKYSDGVGLRYLYRDKSFDEKGIDYSHFIKLRYSSINDNNGTEILYTAEGWRILWYLMTRGKNNIYIKTTPTVIMEDLNMSIYKVKKGINGLIQSEVINCKVGNKKLKELKDKNCVMDIIIIYTDDELIQNIENDSGGYNAIPFDFAFKAVTELNEFEWTILTMIIVFHRYHKIESYTSDDGVRHKLVAEYFYAYPPQHLMAELCGHADRHTVVGYINQLARKKYIDTYYNGKKVSKVDEEGAKPKVANQCYQYYPTLLNRKEYMLQHVIKQEDHFSKEQEATIKKCEKLEELAEIDERLVTKKVFLMRTYGEDLESYDVNGNYEYMTKKKTG